MGGSHSCACVLHFKATNIFHPYVCCYLLAFCCLVSSALLFRNSRRKRGACGVYPRRIGLCSVHISPQRMDSALQVLRLTACCQYDHDPCELVQARLLISYFTYERIDVGDTAFALHGGEVECLKNVARACKHNQRYSFRWSHVISTCEEQVLSGADHGL